MSNKLITQDFLNKSYNQLTIIRDLGTDDKHQQSQVECLCTCGNVKRFILSNVIRGRSKSCGCLKIKSRSLKEPRAKPFGEAPLNLVLCDYKMGARKRNLSFNLDKKDFLNIISSNCFYCGDAPSSKRSSHNKKNFIYYNGIDRINNQLGYEKENCVPCCKFCNLSKSNYTQEIFLEKIKKIYNKHFNNGN